MRILHNSILGAAVLAVAISGCAEKKVCNCASFVKEVWMAYYFYAKIYVWA